MVSRSTHVNTADSTIRQAMAANPALNEPVKSFSHPIVTGPKKPPNVPTELMKASPAAAPMPVRKRGGIDQKMPRADVMPMSAIDKPTMPSTSESNAIENTSPAA